MSFLIISVVLTIKNDSYSQTYQVSVLLRVETVTYTGRVGEPIKRSDNERFIRPGASDEVRLDVSWEEYGPKLLDQSAFNISCLATVKDTDYEYFAQDDFRVRKPDIKIEVRKTKALSTFGPVRKKTGFEIMRISFNISNLIFFSSRVIQ